MEHELKCWPEPFWAICSGNKSFEVRPNDRKYQVGDTLNLREYVPEKQSYTGISKTVIVTYILNGGQFGIENNYVIMSIHARDSSKF